jgi:hypothetical protein
MALLTSMSLIGCAGPKVIESHDEVTRVTQGKTLTAPYDGWFMSDSLYMRYRKAVADLIQVETAK